MLEKYECFAQNDNLLPTIHKSLNLISLIVNKNIYGQTDPLKIGKHQYLKNKNDVIDQFEQFMRNRVGK